MIRSIILGIVLAAAPATALAQQQDKSAEPATKAEARKAVNSVSDQAKSIEKTIEKKTEQPAPGAAIAKCKDGTLSYAKTHTGACAHHRGVAEWYK